jgi:drug/metabolite transporter (DMT)-like permease
MKPESGPARPPPWWQPSLRTWVGPLAMIASAACWALGTTASKAIFDDTSVASLPMLTVQLCASVLVLFVIATALRQPLVQHWRYGWTGLLEPGLAYQLSMPGLALTSATAASVIGSLEPVMVPIVAAALLAHRLQRVQLGITVIATIGAVLVAWSGDGGRHSVKGDLLVLGGVAAAAVYVVLSSKHIIEAPVMALATVQQLWALVLTVAVTLVATFVTGSDRVAADWPQGWTVAAAGGSGVLNYAIPFGLYLTALRHLDVVEAARYLTLIPVFGVGAATLFLGEPLAGGQLIGAAMVVVSLGVLAHVQRKR